MQDRSDDEANGGTSEPIGSPLLNAYKQIAGALERVAASLNRLEVRIGEQYGHQLTNELLDVDALCKRLGVSKRWVQRHVVPAIRSSSRGRAWYRIDDVEAQLKTSTSSPAPALRARRHLVRTHVTPVASDAETQIVEERLRRSLKGPKK